MSEKYSKYELVSPKWMNEDYFEKILQAYEKDTTLKVNSLVISPASANNDHYASLMYRAKIECTNTKNGKTNVSLVVKTMPEEDSAKKELLDVTENSLFTTEIRMYSETIPKMEAVLRKYGDDTVLGARIIYHSMSPHQVIVFEDLAEKGFSTLKNRTPTYEELKRAMLKLAKLHAVSHKLAQEEPEFITNHNNGQYNLDWENIEFYTTGITNFINLCLAVDDDLKEYIPYFKKLDETIVKSVRKLGDAYKTDKKAILVLNHGDFHFKNMMFRHKENGDLDDLMLVDFQTCYYGPAVSDLMYSFYLLWDSDTRWNRRDELIYYYFSNFIESLKTYEYKGELPKMADLQIDLLKYRHLETYLLACFLPFAIAFGDDSIELDKLVESPEERMKVFRTPKVRNELLKALPIYLRRGYLQ